jgi:ADP-ribose pyrophosphatase
LRPAARDDKSFAPARLHAFCTWPRAFARNRCAARGETARARRRKLRFIVAHVGARARAQEAHGVCSVNLARTSLFAVAYLFFTAGKRMEKKHGPWTIRGTREAYRDPAGLVAIQEDEVTKPDGSRGTYATVRLKEGVNVLAVDDDAHAYFAREFRYAVGRETVEVVSGGLEDDETLEAAARRELREELGIEAEEFVELGTIQPVTSLVSSASTLFLARKLRPAEKDEDAGEVIKTVRMPLAEAVAQALSGELIHSTTCLLVLRADHHLKKAEGGRQ